MIALGDGASDAMWMVDDELDRAYLGGWGFVNGISNGATVTHYPAPQKEPEKQIHPELKYWCRACSNDVLGKHLSAESYCPECQVFSDYCRKQKG